MESKHVQPQNAQPEPEPQVQPQSDGYEYEEGGAISDLDLHMSEGSLTIIRIPLIGEMRQELQAAIQRRGWAWQEGLVNVLATGISQLSAQNRETAPAAEEVARNAGQNAGQAELDPVIQELAYYHAVYSAMKFRAFSLLEKLKVLEMRESALKGKLDLDTKWADATRQQLEALQAENVQLKQRIAELGVDTSMEPVRDQTHQTHQPQSKDVPNGDGKENGKGLLGKLQAFLSN